MVWPRIILLRSAERTSVYRIGGNIAWPGIESEIIDVETRQCIPPEWGYGGESFRGKADNTKPKPSQTNSKHAHVHWHALRGASGRSVYANVARRQEQNCSIWENCLAI